MSRIEVRLKGDNIRPGDVRSADIAKLIAAVEQAIEAMVIEAHPALHLKSGDVTIGLKSVELGSYTATFDTNYPEQVAMVIPSLRTALSSGRFDDLPDQSIGSLIEIQAVVRRQKGSAEFAWWRNALERETLGEITLKTAIEVKRQEIASEDMLYGRVRGVSGDKRPRLYLQLLNGDKQECDITAENDLAVARQLARRIYDVVSVTGIAYRDTRTMRLRRFMVTGVGPYEGASLRQSIAAMREMMRQNVEAMGIEAYRRHRDEMEDASGIDA